MLIFNSPLKKASLFAKGGRIAPLFNPKNMTEFRDFKHRHRYSLKKLVQMSPASKRLDQSVPPLFAALIIWQAKANG